MAPDIVYEEEYKPPFLPLLALVFPLMPLFWKYHVRVTKEELSFGYNQSFTMKNAPITSVDSVEIIDNINGLLQWGGWGIRKNLSWETGYISKNGQGIKVTLKYENNKKQVYVFNCEEPEKVRQALQSTNNN